MTNEMLRCHWNLFAIGHLLLMHQKCLYGKHALKKLRRESGMDQPQ